MADEREMAIKRLMEAADQDPELRARLVKDPEGLAKENRLQLQPAEIEQLKRLGQLTDLIDQLKQPGVPGPIFYPIDIWMREEIYAYLIYRPLYKIHIPKLYPPRGYPMREIREILVDRLIAQRYNLLRRR